MCQKTSAKLAAKFRVTCTSFFFGWVQYLWKLIILYFINNFYKIIFFCILLISLGIIGQNNKIYIWKKIIKIKTRIIITRYKYFAQTNYYKHCSATAPSATIFPRLIAVLGACRKCVLDHLGMHFFLQICS